MTAGSIEEVNIKWDMVQACLSDVREYRAEEEQAREQLAVWAGKVNKAEVELANAREELAKVAPELAIYRTPTTDDSMTVSDRVGSCHG